MQILLHSRPNFKTYSPFYGVSQQKSFTFCEGTSEWRKKSLEKTPTNEVNTTLILIKSGS